MDINTLLVALWALLTKHLGQSSHSSLMALTSGHHPLPPDFVSFRKQMTNA
jgi:hypothetical protein